MWIPKNKRTGQEYPAIDDATKAKMESAYATKGKYTFRQVVVDGAPKIPYNINIATARTPRKPKEDASAAEPVEAKKVEIEEQPAE